MGIFRTVRSPFQLEVHSALFMRKLRGASSSLPSGHLAAAMPLLSSALGSCDSPASPLRTTVGPPQPYLPNSLQLPGREDHWELSPSPNTDPPPGGNQALIRSWFYQLLLMKSSFVKPTCHVQAAGTQSPVTSLPPSTLAVLAGR